MTVIDLFEELGQLLDFCAGTDGEDMYDEDIGNLPVFLGQYQNYGSDFVYKIADIETDNGVNSFYGEDIGNAVIITLGKQIGTIKTNREI